MCIVFSPRLRPPRDKGGLRFARFSLEANLARRTPCAGALWRRRSGEALHWLRKTFFQNDRELYREGDNIPIICRQELIFQKLHFSSNFRSYLNRKNDENAVARNRVINCFQCEWPEDSRFVETSRIQLSPFEGKGI